MTHAVYRTQAAAWHEVRTVDLARSPMARVLLLGGAIAGPLFVLTVLVQDYARAGFDPRLQPLSELSLGDLGWIQVLNFVLAGVLNLGYAVGLWRALHPGRAGTWGPLLVGLYGLGLVVVGIFTTDPANGFPPGVAAPAEPSVHGIIHALGGLFTFLSLSAALGVFARLFLSRNEYVWAAYCGLSAVAMLGVFFGGINNPELMARTLRLAMFVGWMAASLIAIKLLSTPQR
jgi:uncharacterized protein DUF998